MGRTIEYLSNTTITACATIATITADDLRLWVVALAGLGLTFISSAHRRYKDKIEAQAARARLCDECVARKLAPASCVVRREHRHINCPLNSKQYGR